MNNRKKLRNITALALLSLACGLASCDDGNKPSSSVASSDSNSEVVESSTTESSSESSSSIDGNFNLWTEDEQALLKEYCGSVLPYPVGMVSGEVTVREYYDSQYEYYYLEIYDQSKTYSLEDYFETLESFGWSAIKTYNGKISQSDTSGISFVELTKCSDDGEVGYDLTYFYNSAISDEEGNVVSGNYLRCYNNLSGRKTSDTAWSETDSSTIKKVTTTTLPYIQLGESNAVMQSGDNTLAIFDYYAEDLTSEIYETLIADDFILNKALSYSNDAYILSKTLTDGASLSVMLYFYGGNNIQVYYTPSINSSYTWPSEVIDEIKNKTGVEVPAFEIATGGSYYYYRKNDSYNIYTDKLAGGFNYETYALNTLKDQAMTWEETISFSSYNIGDDDGEVIGFGIQVNVLTPTSTFVTSYPSEEITNTITDLLGITDVNLPEFDVNSIPASDKKIKYSIKGEDYYQERYDYYCSFIKEYPWMYGLSDNPSKEEIESTAATLASYETGISVSIFDKDEQAYKSYKTALTNACWYEYIDDDENVVFEDPTGQLAVTIKTEVDLSRDNVGETTFYFHKGAGEAREAEFYFQEDNVDVAIGGFKQLILTIKMLPYQITYSSSDETGGISVDQNGEVTVASSVAEGTSAVITASISVPNESEPRTATCTVTAKDITYYTPESAIAAVGAKLTEQGYDPLIVHRDWSDDGDMGFDFARVDLGDATIAEVESLISEHFIPKGFELSEEWESGTIYVHNENDYSETKKRATYTTASIFNDACYVILEYNIYIEDGHTYLYVSAY